MRPTYLDGHLGKIAGPSEPSSDALHRMLVATWIAAAAAVPLLVAAVYAAVRSS